MASIPKASSTPKSIRGRGSIRSTQLVQSPIENRLEGSSTSEQEVTSESEYLTDENSQILFERNQLKKRRSDVKEFKDRSNQKKKQIDQEESHIFKISCLFVIIILLFLVYLFYVSDEYTVNGQTTFENLEKEFPSQQNDFWISINVAINDIVQLNQPKSIIFLYKDVETITNLLKKVSVYASLRICNSEESLNLSGNYLRRKEIIQDYGKFIVEVRNELETKCVVIINNLNEVPGTSAQAFHSLCDEYNPVEEKVLYLFTLKVDEFPKNNYKFVEQRLKELWSDLHGDKFYPLYTRISTFILPVISEN